MTTSTDHTIGELIATGREHHARDRYGDITVDEWFRRHGVDPAAARQEQYRIHRLLAGPDGPVREPVGHDAFLHDDAVVILLQHGVVVAVQRVGELRELLVGEYRHRRLMTLAAYRGTALGTSMHVVVTDPDTLDAATAAAEAVVGAIDLACSRLREDSELSRLQAGEGPREGIVSPLLARALATALRAAELTDGAVDPTVGAAVRNAGYNVDFGAVPADGEALTLTVFPVPGWRPTFVVP